VRKSLATSVDSDVLRDVFRTAVKFPQQLSIKDLTNGKLIPPAIRVSESAAIPPQDSADADLRKHYRKLIYQNSACVGPWVRDQTQPTLRLAS